MKRLEFKIHAGHTSSKWVLGGNIASFAVRDRQPAYNAISLSVNLFFWTLMLTYRTFLKKEDVKREKRGVITGTYNPNYKGNQR
jgi:hypothetical protein